MARRSFDPRDYGIDVDNDGFIDLAVDDLDSNTRGNLSIDELLLRPRVDGCRPCSKNLCMRKKGNEETIVFLILLGAYFFVLANILFWTFLRSLGP